ncbi:uncharacterized protein JCM6883_001320 [Sporobolomyces salmoneus]|uniref:uncharacterized protein n=1 Tax=Sporobolomyces salmoneus TaxID=183962 RepID=UPI003176D3FA
MSRPTLPNELLHDIFSQLSSSKSTLYGVSLASRTFCYIAKPFLYSYVKVTTRGCRDRLKRVRKEDARMVKKLVIDGRKASFENGVGSSETESGHECLVELFRGELLNISSKVSRFSRLFRAAHVNDSSRSTALEILHVVGVRQKELILDLKLEEIKPAMNLVELSVRTHDNGGELWHRVLYSLYCDINRPRLSRVGFFDVTLMQETEGNRRRWRDFLPYTRLLPHLAASVDVLAVSDLCGESTARCAGRILYRIVSEDSFLDWWPYPCNLSLFSLGASFSTPFGAQFASWNGRDLVEISHDLRRMLEAIRPIPRSSRYLSLPWTRSELSPECHSILSQMEEYGIETHFKGDDKEEEDEKDSISLIPRSFVDFVKRQKEKERMNEVEQEQ